MEKHTLQYRPRLITASLCYEIETPQKRQERERTTARKKIFLQILEESRGIISVTCQKAEIARATYYVWMKTDPQFKDAVEKIQAAKPDLLEDRMYILALKEGDFRALKYLMDKVHPGFKAQPSKNKETIVNIYHHATPPSEKEEGELNLGLDQLFSLAEGEGLDQMTPEGYESIKKYIPLAEFIREHLGIKSEENPVAKVEKIELETEQKTEPSNTSSEITAPDILEPKSKPELALFTRNMSCGCSPGEDVKLAQQILNMDPETELRVHGESGSPGHEKTIFGNAMKKAVERFQIKHDLFNLLDDEYGNIEIRTREKLQEVYYKNKDQFLKNG